MRTIAEIDADINNVRAEMQGVHGRTTEVYARIVGYYRSVRNWNRGKREEYRHRKLFIADEAQVQTHLPSDEGYAAVKAEVAAPAAANPGTIARYELFVRKTCPNCPPVKECCANLPVSGEQIDVDSEAGRESAVANGVFSAPTAIFYDGEGAEVGRAHSVLEIRSLSARMPAAEPVASLF